MSNLYIVDTSTFIEYVHWYSKSRRFWETHLPSLVTGNRMNTTMSVSDELQKRNDNAASFCKKYKGILIKDIHKTDMGDRYISEQVDRYKNNIDLSNSWQTDFDVVALARCKKREFSQDLQRRDWEVIVISYEKSSGNQNSRSAKLPDVCNDYRIKHIIPWELLNLENLDLDASDSNPAPQSTKSIGHDGI